MALLIKDNYYFKINLDGSYFIYKNKTARNKEKKAPKPEVIIAKYKEIIAEITSIEYQRYHEKTGDEQAWIEECQKYCLNLQNHKGGEKYPLMEQYFADVANSIPEIVSRGTIGIQAKTLKELYNYLKQKNIFGEENTTKDA